MFTDKGARSEGLNELVKDIHTLKLRFEPESVGLKRTFLLHPWPCSLEVYSTVSCAPGAHMRTGKLMCQFREETEV